jgi:Sap-like sulfolipid-1-addressing protein
LVSFAEVLPLALVMVIGPQIVTAFFLATSVRWAENSAAFLAGGVVAVTAVVTAVYLVARAFGAGGSGGSSGVVRDAIDWLVLALMVFLIVRVYLTRRRSQTPRWMGRLQQATPWFSFRLSLALLGVFPTDIAT